MHDDGVFLVALNHADIEEAGIFAIHDVMHQRTVAVAVILRRLHKADAWIGEYRNQVLQPVRSHDIVRIDNADDLGIHGSSLHGDAQGAGLEALDLLRVDELEALAECAAVILDRLPERGIRRVVDDDDTFEVRIVEPRHRIERCFEHVRGFEISRDMDRYFRKAHAAADGRRHCRLALEDQTPRLLSKGDRCDLFDPRHRDQHQRHQQDQAERQREGRTEDKVVPGPESKHGRGPGTDAVGCGRQCQGL